MKIQIRPWLPEDVDTFMGWVADDPKILESMGVDETDELEIALSFSAAPVISPILIMFLPTSGGSVSTQESSNRQPDKIVMDDGDMPSRIRSTSSARSFFP